MSLREPNTPYFRNIPEAEAGMINYMISGIFLTLEVVGSLDAARSKSTALKPEVCWGFGTPVRGLITASTPW